jgi:hypothetical protein
MQQENENAMKRLSLLVLAACRATTIKVGLNVELTGIIPVVGEWIRMPARH